LTAANPEIFGFFGEKDTKITKTMGKDILRKMFGNLSESVIEHYLPDDVAEDEYDYVRYQVYTSLGDKNIFCPTVYYAEQSASRDCDVYYYAWVHRPSVSPWAPWMGSTHFF
ncbi:acetylcholinesterase-1, partial [Caerostris extrusa]